MNIFNLREPVSAASHGVWLLLSLPGAALLWRRSGGDRAKQWSLFGYTLSLAFCAGSSTLYHGASVPDALRDVFLLMDHIGIFVLIAGTYTPIAVALLRGRWRRNTLLLVWFAAGSGALLRATCTTLPLWVSTTLYLGMGWGSIFCYFELARTLSHRTLRLIVLGGVVYSVGAVANLAAWPVLWPGVIESHEVFHVFVVAGSLCHFLFMLGVVAPSGRPHVPACGAHDTPPRPIQGAGSGLAARASTSRS